MLPWCVRVPVATARVRRSQTCAICLQEGRASVECLQNHAGGGLRLSPPPAGQSFRPPSVPRPGQRLANRPFILIIGPFLSLREPSLPCPHYGQARMSVNQARSEKSYHFSLRYRPTPGG